MKDYNIYKIKHKCAKKDTVVIFVFYIHFIVSDLPLAYFKKMDNLGYEDSDSKYDYDSYESQSSYEVA